MKNLIYLSIALFFTTANSNAQTTAMDFNRMDCNGNMQHLFADLDAGNAVIIEFFMQNCGACPVAGQKLEALKADLLAQFPGKVKSYAIGYVNSYTCSSVANWVTNNGFTAIPIDSGATQVAYYGGMGMPTIVVLGGGTSHLVLGSPYLGLSTSDTTTIGNDIRDFLGATAINETVFTSFNLFPNPANDMLTLSFDMKESGNLNIEIFDMLGKKVSTLMNDNVSAQKFKRSFSTASLAAGNYVLQLSINGNSVNHKLNITR
ncbi:MAG: hypothetical protein POELPBGB_00793 [Bacteroidia bacterium]|nr:hypothetical protein [Bacteroidia bacterium]